MARGLCGSFPRAARIEGFMEKFSDQKEAREWVISERKYIRNLRADADRFSQIANMCVDKIHAVKKDWELEEDL